MLRAPGEPFLLRNSRDRSVVATHLETAFDSNSRRRGLLGRTVFEEGHALIIAPSNSIHTFFMRMTIDVIFVARDGRVLKVRPALPAWRMALALRAFAVIELPAGAVARSATRRGDTLIVEHA